MTNVSFQTTDSTLQRLYDTAESKCKQNVRNFGEMQILVEGSSLYPFAWLETQPMGGEMYAKRNLKVGLNNQLLFMKYQRKDGRFPGYISNEKGKVTPFYTHLQGYFFPISAYKMYSFARLGKEYLLKLYESLKKFDEYLWKYRDSNNDGCLETWCIWDTGEDCSTRFQKGAPNAWKGEKPPHICGLPYASMDMMAFSYGGRDTLARISHILQNGKENLWRKKAQSVAKKIHDFLWVDQKNACYDRDSDGNIMNVLIHNSLRVMYFGAFSQEMADRFLKYHLFNPEEFWTKMPLPSIAVNDPLFRNHEQNDWSGQPEGLTYQRAIHAFENYGHFAELTVLGLKLLQAVGAENRFTQQFDPFTGRPSLPELDGYGPTILSVLEYISRMFGIYIEENKVFWSVSGDKDQQSQYVQNWFGKNFLQETGKKSFCGFLNGKELFNATKGVRIITDLEGSLLGVIGIDPEARKNVIELPNATTYPLFVAPNEVYRFTGNSFQKKESAPFLL
jgi:hypothetical protein